MERQGIVLDCDYLERKREQALAEVDVQEARLNRWAHDYTRQLDCPINWGSPAQLKGFLYEFKNYPIPAVIGTSSAAKKNNKKEQSTSEASLHWLSKNTTSDTDREMLETLLTMKRVGKLAQFMKKLPEHVSSDGRLRCSLGPNTDTGRLSCRNPNLQQIPTRNDKFKIRKAFRAGEGMLFVVADYSQLEMYVLAHFLIHRLNDHSLADDLRDGDVHLNTALRIWNDPERRPDAKTVNYAIPYGKTAAGLGSQIKGPDGRGIGKAAAQEILDAYFEAYPGLDELFELWKNEARTTGFVHTLLGRTRPLPDAASTDQWERFPAERRAVNTPVQGSAADIVTAAMLQCVGPTPTWGAKELRATGAKLVLQIHDELIFEVPELQAERACSIIVDKMENPFDEPLKVQLKVDANIGKSWGDCK